VLGGDDDVSADRSTATSRIRAVSMSGNYDGRELAAGGAFAKASLAKSKGRNVTIEYRWAADRDEQLRKWPPIRCARKLL
jgi:hypothetical protein